MFLYNEIFLYNVNVLNEGTTKTSLLLSTSVSEYWVNELLKLSPASRRVIQCSFQSVMAQVTDNNYGLEVII